MMRSEYSCERCEMRRDDADDDDAILAISSLRRTFIFLSGRA